MSAARLISLGIGSPASIAASLTFGLLGDDGGSPPDPVIPVAPSSYVGGNSHGGGGSIYYQVPRAKLTLKQRPNDHLEAIITASHLRTMHSTLTDPERASPKMIAEANAAMQPHAKDDGHDYEKASQDPATVASMQAIHGRYSAKLKELWKAMKDEGDDPHDFH